MRLGKNTKRSIEFRSAKTPRHKSLPLSELGDYLIDLGNALKFREPLQQSASVKALYKGGVYIEIHATRPRAKK